MRGRKIDHAVFQGIVSDQCGGLAFNAKEPFGPFSFHAAQTQCTYARLAGLYPAGKAVV